MLLKLQLHLVHFKSFECRGWYLWLFLEYAEHCASTSAHLCVRGAEIVKLLFDICQYGVSLESRCLEVVCQLFPPSIYWLAYNVAAAHLRFLGHNLCICVFGRHSYGSLYDHKAISVEVAFR